MPTRFCSCYPRVQAVMLSGGATLLPYIGALDVGFTLLRELVGILVPARGSLAGLLCSPGRVMLSCGGEGTRVTLSLFYGPHVQRHTAAVCSTSTLPFQHQRTP